MPSLLPKPRGTHTFEKIKDASTEVFLVFNYYSVVAGTSSFGASVAGASVAVIIMASVLEASKLVTASFLYQHWKGELSNP